MIEKENATLDPVQAFENLIQKDGDWSVEGATLTQTDPAVIYARAFVASPMWVDSIIKAKIRIDSLGGTEDWNGARMIVRGDATGDTFFTVGLWAGGDEVRIEKATNLTFTQMKADHQGSPAAAPFPIEIGKTYELTVVVDHSTIYCYIDGEFLLMAQEPDFTAQPFGRVGFFTNGAAATFSDVSVRGIKGIAGTGCSGTAKTLHRLKKP